MGFRAWAFPAVAQGAHAFAIFAGGTLGQWGASSQGWGLASWAVYVAALTFSLSYFAYHYPALASHSGLATRVATLHFVATSVFWLGSRLESVALTFVTGVVTYVSALAYFIHNSLGRSLLRTLGLPNTYPDFTVWTFVEEIGSAIATSLWLVAAVALALRLGALARGERGGGAA